MRDAYVLPVILLLSLGSALTSAIGIWLFVMMLVITAIDAFLTLVGD